MITGREGEVSSTAADSSLESNPPPARDLSQAARGLTLVNAGLGLALWALVWFLLGGPPRAVALLGTCAGFLMVVGFVHGAIVPGAPAASVFAWSAAASTFLHVLVRLFAFAQETQPPAWFVWTSLGVSGASYFTYLLLLVLKIRRNESGFGLLVHWIAALLLLLVVVVVGWIGLALLPGDAEQVFLTAAALSQVLFIAALSSLMLRMRRRMMNAPAGDGGGLEPPKSS